MRELIVGKNDCGQRIDKFLSKAFPTMPKSLIYKYIRTKKIKVEKKRTSPEYMLNEGERIQFYIPDEFFMALDGEEKSFMSIRPHLDIVYEDENVLLVDKKVGMLCHSDDNESANTLIDHIKAYLYQKGEYDPENEMSFAPSLCNRIDRNTAGIVIAAKNAESLRIMNEKIKNNEVQKYYICAVHGVFKKKSELLTAYLIKNSDNNTVKIYPEPRAGAKKIITEYKVLKQKQDRTLLEIHLITGKTHQIRSHMAYIGHPLLGEGKYGINREDKKSGYFHQALYSYSVFFDFKGEDGVLSYLSGKRFFVDEKNIWFMKDFDR